MREGVRNFTVGLASIIALLGLSWLLMSFGELDFLFHPRYQIAINTTDASGLRAGSGIEYNGVPIGVIDDVTFQEDPAYPVHIRAFIDSNVRLPADVQPYASMPLIGSTAVLQLRRAGGSPNVLRDDGLAVINEPMRGGMLAEISEQLDARMQPLMESLERFNRLSDTFVSLGENLNTLFVPQTPEELEQGAAPNVHTAIARLNIVLDEAQQGLELANSFLGDEQLRTDARGAVHRANHLIEQATAAIDTYTQLAQSLKQDSTELTQRLLPVADALAVTLEEVRRVAKMAQDGKGTVGQMLNNPDLYNSLTDATRRLDRTLIELQTLIQQMREEGVIFKF
jgi:phospholipid/cholesterol/gamma-HCH transport system substrate-binding protein